VQTGFIPAINKPGFTARVVARGSSVPAMDSMPSIIDRSGREVPAMPNQCARVIPIRRAISVSVADQLVADFAFTLWLSSAFRGASPKEALITAQLLIKREKPPRLFLVPNRKHELPRILGWSFTHLHQSFRPFHKGLEDFSGACIQGGVAENPLLPSRVA
jgi:hypothetical protein